MRHSRQGITLFELLVALAISGFAMLGGIILDQLHDSDARIGQDSKRDAAVGNGDRLLRRLLADARTTTDTADRFRGDERNASFLTLCDMPSGWPEPCRATFSVDSLTDSSAIVAQTGRGEHVEVRRVLGAASFRYLDLASSMQDSAWVRRWSTSIALPSAVAVLTETDTVVLPLGSVR